MKQFDGVVHLYNEKFGKPARAIMQELYSQKKLTPTPFDEPIEFTYWELWHDEGADTYGYHAVIETTAAALMLMGAASHADARAEAAELWRDRHLERLDRCP